MLDRKRIYHRILDLTMKTGHAHLPSAFSVVEILCRLYDQRGPYDKIILSKGHGCYAQYAILMELGVMPEDFPVKGHPDYGMPGVECSTGSLGHGLPIALGIALAKRIKKEPGTVYCIVGDGESEEGTFWEAMNLVAEQEVGHSELYVLVDNNENRLRGEFNVHILGHPKGYPSKLMMADPKAWHHKVPSSDEMKVLREEIDALSVS